MKAILNILIALSVLFMMSDCEANAGNTALDYSNSIFAASGLLVFGFLRVYYREFIDYLNKPQ